MKRIYINNIEYIADVKKEIIWKRNNDDKVHNTIFVKVKTKEFKNLLFNIFKNNFTITNY